MYKQVFIVRKDLNMRKGKIASQVGHACTKLFLNLFTMELDSDGDSWFKPKQHVAAPLLDWLNENMKN